VSIVKTVTYHILSFYCSNDISVKNKSRLNIEKCVSVLLFYTFAMIGRVTMTNTKIQTKNKIYKAETVNCKCIAFHDYHSSENVKSHYITHLTSDYPTTSHPSLKINHILNTCTTITTFTIYADKAAVVLITGIVRILLTKDNIESQHITSNIYKFNCLTYRLISRHVET